MESKETKRKYELVIVVDASLESAEKERILKESTETVKKAGANIISSEVWLEKQKFTFEIKKVKEGTYYLLRIEGKAPVIEKINSNLRLNEKILRYSLSKAEGQPVFETSSAAA